MDTPPKLEQLLFNVRAHPTQVGWALADAYRRNATGLYERYVAVVHYLSIEPIPLVDGLCRRKNEQ